MLTAGDLLNFRKDHPDIRPEFQFYSSGTDQWYRYEQIRVVMFLYEFLKNYVCLVTLKNGEIITSVFDVSHFLRQP